LVFISEKQGDVTLQKLRKPVRMRLKAGLFISTEGDSQNSIFTHHELAVSKLFLEAFEVIGRHVVEGEDVEELILGHESLSSFNDKLFVLSGFGFGLR
jgi:hypothetical protein